MRIDNSKSTCRILDDRSNTSLPLEMLRRLLLALVGLLFLGTATLFWGPVRAYVLVDVDESALSWGPTLFRILLTGHGILLLLLAVCARPCRAAAMDSRGSTRSLPGQRAFLVLFASLILTSLLLRLWCLDTCLWLDEVLTLTRYARPPLGTILTSFPDQNQHMLYSVLAHFSLVLFGESAWALRLPAVIFGVASIWALYALGKQITNRTEALLAATLMTVSYHHVWFSQNARGYSGLLFFTLWSTCLFIQGIRQGRWSLWVLYAVSVALGFWVHLTMVFVVLSHAAVYVAYFAASFGKGIRERTEGLTPATRWRPFLALALAATMTLQLYALSLPEFLASALHEVSLPSEWTNPFWVVRETLANLQVGFAGLAGVLVALTLFIAGLVSIGRRDCMFIALLVLPGVLGGASMLLLHHNLWPRFFFYCAGYAFLVLVRGTLVAGEMVLRAMGRPAGVREDGTGRLGLAAVLLMAVVLATMLPRCYRLPKQDYLGARSYVESRQRPGEPIVAVGLAALSYSSYYAPDWLTPGTRPELDAIRRGATTTWLVYTFPPHMKAFCPDLWEAVQEDFEVVEVFPGSLNAGEIYVCCSRRGEATVEAAPTDARALLSLCMDQP